MSTIYSYDLKGNKLSFANWVSNLSPEETPFCSMTKKEKVNQVMFQWQSDRLNPSGVNASIEGNTVFAPKLGPTQTHYNYTQILRKVVKVSDTADSIANYGRENELSYQTMKAGAEIKRDLEWAYLNNEKGVIGSNDVPRETAGFRSLVAPAFTADPSTGAVVHKTFVGDLDYLELTDMMYNLYLAGSQANIIMYHPKLAKFFSSLQESKVGKFNKVRLFEGTNIASFYVDEILSPWCQKFKLIPNRLMPEGQVYFFNPDDFTQMVLREPQRVKLSKSGSSQKTMIEMEMGLRLSNPYAAGVLSQTHRLSRAIFDITSKIVNGQDAHAVSQDPIKAVVGGVLYATYKLVGSLTRSYDDNTSVNFAVYKDGRVILRKDNVPLGSSGEIVIHNTFSPADAGVYKIVAESKDFYDDTYEFTVVEDPNSVVICTNGDFMRSVNVDGTTMNSYNKSMTLNKGDNVTFNVLVKDTAYDDCTWLLNKSNNDGTFTTIKMEPVTSDISYTFQNVDSTFNGEYSITIVSGKGCSQTTKTLILDVKDDPSDACPFKDDNISVNGWVLQDGINSTVVPVDNGNPIEVSYEITAPFVGKNVEIVTSLWGKAVHTRKAVLGKDTYTVTLKPSEDTTYMFRVVDNDKVHLSASFTLEVVAPTTPPVVSDIFDPSLSYVGDALLSDDSIAVAATIGQFAGKFFAISEYANQANPITYQMFNTADTSIVFDLELKGPVQDMGSYVYKYLGAVVKTSDSGDYVLRAVRNGHVQDSKPFTLAFRNL